LSLGFDGIIPQARRSRLTAESAVDWGIGPEKSPGLRVFENGYEVQGGIEIEFVP
jgi:hypothetical protein